jgi:hypothetical protein
MFLGLLYFYTIIKILTTIVKRKRKEKRNRFVLAKYKSPFEDVLLNKNDLREDEVEALLGVKNIFLKEYEKKHLTYLLIEITKDNEVNAKNYKTLVDLLSLVEMWEKKMQKSSFRENKEALRVLAAVNHVSNSSFISQKLNDSNDSLRKHIKSEYVKVAINDPFKVLEDNFDKDFNELDGIRLHEALKNKAETYALPILTKWLQNTENDAYQCFIIKEISYFNQRVAAPFLLDLFKRSSSSDVKIQIVNTLGDLKYHQAIPLLKDEYHYSSTLVQDAIIGMIGDVGTAEAFRVLKDIYLETHSREAMIRILKNMYHIDKVRTKSIVDAKGVITNKFEEDILKYFDRQALIEC